MRERERERVCKSVGTGLVSERSAADLRGPGRRGSVHGPNPRRVQSPIDSN